MSIGHGETTFLDFLREAEAGRGRGNDELVRAVVPLIEQVLEHHDHGRVAPLAGVDTIFADGGQLWFCDADALAPTIDYPEIRKREGRRDGGVDVVDRTAVTVDIDEGRREVTTRLLGHAEQGIEHPIYLPGYVSWEHEVGHHDALTDVFSLGMLLASLAIGADFTEPDELERFVVGRHRLTDLSPNLHPVIAKAIVRMTELDRHARAQDLRGLLHRLEHYREVDETVDQQLDFRNLEGFIQSDRSSRRKLILEHLQSRLFDRSKKNRLIWYRPTLQTLDLTEASVPTQLDVERIRPEDLMLWHGSVAEALSEQKPLRLDRYLRFEETPYARGVLDKIRSQARRDKAEYGFAELRLVIAFFNWHNLREDPDERIRSPLLLLPVELERKRGVRDSYVLVPQSEIAEVNPMLRHVLKEIYALELPEQVDLRATDIETLHKALAAEIARSEPGITLHLIQKPQIRLVHERARRRLAAWRRKSAVTGRGIRRHGDVPYSYSRTNFQPLGLQLLIHKVKPERLELAEHFEGAKVELTPVPTQQLESSEPAVKETSREVYNLTEQATGRFDWALDLTHLTLGNFNSRKMSLVRDYHGFLQEADEQPHPALDRLLSLDAREMAEPPSASREPLAPYIVVPADPTQTAALHWARQGRDFIIQGPPGTGKSQTITNLIADFAGCGKRVLFVCEKRAALDVVFGRLAQHGLDEISVLIHDSQSDKKAFIAELGETYARWLEPLDDPPPSEAPRARLEGKLGEPLEALARFSDAITAPAEGAAVSVCEVLRTRLRAGSPPALSLEHAERIPEHRTWQEHREAILALGRALEELSESAVLAELPLLHLRRNMLEAERPVAALQEGLSAIEAQLEPVREARNLVRDGATAEELNEALAMAKELRPLADRNLLALLDPGSEPSRQLDDAVSRHAKQSRALAKATDNNRAWRRKLERADVATSLAQARRFEAMFILFVIFLPAWWRLRRILKACYDFKSHAVAPSWTAVLEALAEEHACEDGVAEIEAEARERFSFDGSLPEFAEICRKLRSPEGRTPLQISLAARWAADGAAELTALLDAAHQIESLSEAVSRVFDEQASVAVEELAERVRAVRRAADLLPELRGPLARLASAPPRVRDAVRHVPVRYDRFDSAVAEITLERTFRANRPLARFDHDALDRRMQQLAEHHKDWLAANAAEVRRLVRERFRERARIGTLPASQLTAEQKELKKAYNTGRRVLEREFKKVMRHKSIRELSSGDSGTVLYDLKPVWLMSPLSISDTIPAGEQRFDVVIFDEASQIPLEEAIPAVYRAPQMIVVGDEMQLPPTTFFAAKRDDEGAADADDHYDLDADSFLTHAARRLPSTMLGWHYRSRSEALIRFSNQAFYAGKLLTIPDRDVDLTRERIAVADVSAGDANAALVLDRAISFHKLSCGLYHSRRNTPEAEYIARLVRGLLQSDRKHSIGIVAFSEAQQDEIESALTRLASEDEAFQRTLEAEYEREEDGQMVGLFVKNLENVQGDERDVIILSICYAPDATGKMLMNFGPINKGGGEKRLNVVFSRAKRHMAVVSSIHYSAITNEYNEGANCFRRYLQYAEAMSIGDLDTANLVARTLDRSRASEEHPADEPVLDQLTQALQERGYQVDRAVGSSGFRIDLALRKGDDKRVLALLVDTPRHYQSRNIMERYHTRPTVLRAFGWEVELVLTKEWLAAPEACLKRIDQAYRRATTPPPERPSALPQEPLSGPVQPVA